MERKVNSANTKFKEPEEPDSVNCRYGQIFETSTKKQAKARKSTWRYLLFPLLKLPWEIKTSSGNDWYPVFGVCYLGGMLARSFSLSGFAIYLIPLYTISPKNTGLLGFPEKGDLYTMVESRKKKHQLSD